MNLKHCGKLEKEVVEMARSEKSIGLRLKSVNNMIRRKMDTMIAEEGAIEVCGMQGPMIKYIYDMSLQQDVFQRDLEKEFNIRRSTATVMLQTLEQKGFIIREPVACDARLKKIVLTEKGIEQNNLVGKKIDGFNAKLEDGITQEEKEEFFCILDKIVKNLE